ncbi:neuronal pentraxin-2-like [Branchiostoma floridae x Branchiostoma japonicum]
MTKWLRHLPCLCGTWHVLCATWRSTNGAWQFYFDGVLRNSGSGLSTGGRVGTGGTWILGQDQDTVGGGFDASQAFIGDLSQVNLWNRVLSSAEMNDQSASCDRHGNVIDWADTFFDKRGKVTSSAYSPCKQ